MKTKQCLKGIVLKKRTLAGRTICSVDMLQVATPKQNYYAIMHLLSMGLKLILSTFKTKEKKKRTRKAKEEEKETL